MQRGEYDPLGEPPALYNIASYVLIPLFATMVLTTFVVGYCFDQGVTPKCVNPNRTVAHC